MISNVLGALASANQSLSTSQLSLASGKSVRSTRDGASNWNVARRAETTSRVTAAGNTNAANAIDMIETAIVLYKDLESDLIRLQEIAEAYADTTLSADEKVAIEAEASIMADKWSGDGSITNFTYNGQNIYDASIDLAVTSTGEAANASGAAAAGNFAFQTGTTLQVSSPGTIFDITGIGSGSIALDGSGAAGSVAFDTGTIEQALQSARSEMNNMATMASLFQNVINFQEQAITASNNIQSRNEDVDVAAQTVKQTKLAIFQQIATAQTAAANTQSRQVLGLF